VPQWYLKRFADEKNKLRQISTAAAGDPVKGRGELVTPSGTGWKPHFYTTVDELGTRSDEAERFWSIIENDAALAVERVVSDGDTIQPEEEAAIAAFVAAQLVRGVMFREWLESILLKPFWERNVRYELPAELDATSSDVLVGDQRDPGRPRLARTAAVDLMLASYNELGLSLFRRAWQIHRYPEPVLFTGDQPATLFDKKLPVSAFEAAEIRIPLDRRHALVMGPPDPEKRLARSKHIVIEVDDLRIAHRGNLGIGDWSPEFLFDHPDGPLKEGLKLWFYTHQHHFDAFGSRRRPLVIERNEPCPCGSGMKFKRCHGG
jgi:Protein of unknown function (DUF4238)/SEC-C motif